MYYRYILGMYIPTPLFNFMLISLIRELDIEQSEKSISYSSEFQQVFQNRYF